jgi:GTP-binding protein
MALNLQNSNLRISAGLLRQFPGDPIPQVAFSGRSNVGKSSLINTLLVRKKLARVSSTPGKTITINFYDVDKKLFLVDLPGYGFAKRTFTDKQQWSSLTDGYFLRLRAFFAGIAGSSASLSVSTSSGVSTGGSGVLTSGVKRSA